jgi:hypothetical protein
MFSRSILRYLCLKEEELLLLLQKMGAFALSCFLDLDFWIACGCGCMRLGASWKGWRRMGIVNAVV